MGAGHLVEGGDEGDHPLAGLERAHVGDQGPVDRHAQRGEHGAVGPLGRLTWGEPLVVHPVRRHHNRCPHLAHGAQPVLSHLADADQHAGVPGGAADGTTEEGRLGAEVPFGMVEECAVVDRHGTGHGRVGRHRVMRPVVDLHPEGAQHRTEPDLLVDQPARPRRRDHVADGGAGGQVVPALRVAAARQQGEPDIVASGEAVCQRHGVVAGATRPRRDGGGVERQVEMLSRHRNDRHSSIWARAAPRQVRADAYAAPWLRSSARRTSSVNTAARPRAMSSMSSGSTMRAGAGPTAPRSRTLGTSLDTTVGMPHAHGLQRRQAVALRERHIGEGAGPPVHLGEDGVGNGTSEDDMVGGPGHGRLRAPTGRPDDHQWPRGRK